MPVFHSAPREVVIAANRLRTLLQHADPDADSVFGWQSVPSQAVAHALPAGALQPGDGVLSVGHVDVGV